MNLKIQVSILAKIRTFAKNAATGFFRFPSFIVFIEVGFRQPLSDVANPMRREPRTGQDGGKKSLELDIPDGFAHVASKSGVDGIGNPL